MEWAAAAAGLFTIIGLLLKAWMANSPERTQEARNAAIQQGRTDIANGNVAAVSQRIDSVPPAAPGDTPRLGDDTDTARRLAEITDK
ncbi:MAG: hypothetical protein M0Z43_09760 [Acidithiobacillus sp.]|nr:hypothetical protein [Acidithiobacillus sp.]